METLKFLLRDFFSGIQELEIGDLIRPSLFLLWAGILCFPLKGIDRRDRFGCAVYALFAMFAGVTLIIALPAQFHPDKRTFIQNTADAMGFALVASCRWIFEGEKARVKKTATATPKEK